jgi:hypothetical protein
MLHSYGLKFTQGVSQFFLALAMNMSKDAPVMSCLPPSPEQNVLCPKVFFTSLKSLVYTVDEGVPGFAVEP